MIRKLVVVLITAAAISLSLSAQEGMTRKQKKEEATKRTLEGLVTGANEEAAVGAVVKLKDLKSLSVRSFITKDDGMYHFSGLSMNDDYQVWADFTGLTCKPRNLSVYDSRKKPRLDLKLEKPEKPEPKS
ncbi:MAG TPA: carboxypeptidase-like regulatory domain-containing protein [Bryobacteraceae bacterium]|jgi:hypothetical protein